MVRSHARSTSPMVRGTAPIPFLYSYVFRYWYMVMAWNGEKLTFPVYPILKRSFMRSIFFFIDFMNSSLRMFHPAPADQKLPHRLFSPNCDEPVIRHVPSTKYRLRKE